jgi:3-hydroxyisobutyrate dehydrogenase-like beta-hydroxyacid dehydrogenase
VRPLLTTYGSPLLHVGPLGHGQLVKLVNNALFSAGLGLAADALRLAEVLGVDGATLLGAVAHGSGSSRALVLAAAAGSVQGVADTVGQFVGKDVAVVRAVAARLGADLGLLGDVLGSPFVRERVLVDNAVAAAEGRDR